MASNWNYNLQAHINILIIVFSVNAKKLHKAEYTYLWNLSWGFTTLYFKLPLILETKGKISCLYFI